jgi:membrane protein
VSAAMKNMRLAQNVLRGVWDSYWRDECLILSAAVSFYAIFSIIPFVFLLFVIWGVLVGSSDLLYQQIVQFAKELMPDISPQILEDIRTVVAHRKALGWVGILFLVWVFDVVFYSIAHAFDRIFGRDWKRKYYKMKLFSFAALLFVGFVLYASVYLTFIATAIRNTGVMVFGFHLSHYVAGSLTFRSTIYFLLIGVFTALFLILPHKQIRLRYALFGGLLCVNLWYLAKIAFRWYLENIAVFNIVYGALGTLIVIVLWIFYYANILLISAECVAVIQNRWENRLKEREGIGTGTNRSPPAPISPP